MITRVSEPRRRWRAGGAVLALIAVGLGGYSGTLLVVPFAAAGALTGWLFATYLAIPGQCRGMAERWEREDLHGWSWYHYAALLVGMFIVPAFLNVIDSSLRLLLVMGAIVALAVALLAMSATREFDPLE